MTERHAVRSGQNESDSRTETTVLDGYSGRDWRHGVVQNLLIQRRRQQGETARPDDARQLVSTDHRFETLNATWNDTLPAGFPHQSTVCVRS